MRWKKSKVESGALRYVKKFAFFPTTVEGEITIWLEFYWSQQLAVGKWSPEDRHGNKVGAYWREIAKLSYETYSQS